MDHLELKLPGRYKNVIKDATIEIVDGNIIITPKKQEFKYGDILVAEDGSCPFIFKGIKDGLPQYIIGLATDKTLMFSTGRPWTFNKTRKATDKESTPLLDALEKSGKRWNPGTKQIEDILKVGDICIFWDDGKCKANINTLTHIDESDFPYRSNDGYWYKNAIKCTSLEQYQNFISEV